jgi:hypothetical protein
MNTAKPPVLSHNFPASQHAPSSESPAAVKISLQRVACALSTKTINAPTGMTRDEKREFIIEHATQ